MQPPAAPTGQYPPTAQYPPAQPAPPRPYAQQPYPQAPYPQQPYPQQFQQPPRKDHTVRNIIIGVGGGLSLLLVIGVVLVVIVATSVFGGNDETLAADPVAPTVPGFTNAPAVPTEEPVAPPATTDPVVPDPAQTTDPTEPDDTVDPPDVDPSDPYANYAETAWKSGDSWLERPKSKNITRFSAKYDKPASWLKSIDRLPDGLKVVITKNKDLNCGWSSSGYSDDYSAAGCYRSEYGKTLFMYWGKYATEDVKKLVLLHELSHFHQSWDYYDATTSAYASDMSSSDIKKIVETDATCRVYYDWDYTEYRYLDSDISSPCGDTKWSKNWMEKKFEKYGVVIKDW